MGNAIETTKTFQEKISDKIKESIGDLITDEDLKPLIEKSIEQLLTEERIVRRAAGSYGHDTLPPLLQEILAPILATQISKAVDVYLVEHPDVFTSVIEDVIKDGFITSMITHLNTQLHTPLMHFQSEVQNIFMKHNMS